jgi:hypothetical protein
VLVDPPDPGADGSLSVDLLEPFAGMVAHEPQPPRRRGVP